MSSPTTGGVNANSGSVTAYPVAPLEPLSYEQFYESSEPSAVAVINGSNYQLVSFEIERNAHGAPDSAIIDLTLSNNPDWLTELYRDTNQNEPVYVEIWAGFPPPGMPTISTSSLNQRFIGVLDIYTLQIDGDLGTFRCRSLAAPLVDTPITTLVQNMNSAQFVQFWADKLNLKAVIAIPGTAVPVSSVVGNDTVGTFQNVRVWDVIVQMAQLDDVDVWVDGTTLYYAAQSVVNTVPVDLKYGRDLYSLSITHSPQGNKNVRVDVHSYQRDTRTSTTARVQTNSAGGYIQRVRTVVVNGSVKFGQVNDVTTVVGPNGQPVTQPTPEGGSFSSGFTFPVDSSGLMTYVRRYPNRTPSQCLAIALALWKQFSRLEYLVTMHLPVTKAKGFGVAAMTALIRLHGTPYFLAESSNSSAVNDYFPRRTTEEFNDEGWGLTIEAVNHENVPGGAA